MFYKSKIEFVILHFAVMYGRIFITVVVIDNQLVWPGQPAAFGIKYLNIQNEYRSQFNSELESDKVEKFNKAKNPSPEGPALISPQSGGDYL